MAEQLLRAIRSLLVASLAVGLTVVLPAPALATTGPYTRPFFEPGVSVYTQYGCIYDSEVDYPSFDGKNADGTDYDCADFHAGIDYPINYLPVAAARSGTVVKVVDGITTHVCAISGDLGNYVLIKHDSSHYTFYLHLKADTILVNTTDKKDVSAGQKIATSGNSGQSCNPHLHYGLTLSTTYPARAQYSYNPNNYWTTGGSGRVPWKHPDELWVADVCYGATVTFAGNIQNTGGRTWSPSNDEYGRGRIILYSTDSGGDTPVASQFATADWEAPDRPGRFDQSSVAPDGTATFTFGLKGSGTQGQYYTNYLNLRANALRWFPYAGYVFRIRIFIVPHQQCF
jgi:hypothetical protein